MDRSDFFSSFIDTLTKEKGVSNVRVSVKYNVGGGGGVMSTL